MSAQSLIFRLRAHRARWLVLFDVSALVSAYWIFAALDSDLLVLGSGFAAHTLTVAAVAVMLQVVLGVATRLYMGRVIVASLEETVLLSIITLGVGMVMTVGNAIPALHRLSGFVPLGATFMALLWMLLGRAIWRRFAEQQNIADALEARPTLVFGAGSAGRQLVRSMLVTPDADLRPVALLDDDPWKRALKVDGVPVAGTRKDISRVAARTGAKVLVVAVPAGSPELVRDVSTAAREAGLQVKVLPGVRDLLATGVTIRDVRDINMNDLLGRGPVETDVASIASYLNGKRVLVTGAGGSIGSELCSQIHKWNPAELMMLDRDESALHGVQLSIHGRALLDSPDVVLADIRDLDALMDIFKDRRPEVVFHAAALKHLPMLEQYPAEALKTNVLGTINVLKASAAVGVERFVNISTDKAADPCSVLGYSKRAAERLTAAVAADTAGQYLSVRFGNVLGSRGSVLTAFTAQIAAGGPVTVTHPDVTRYFMTIPEAVQLVIQAGAIGCDGEVMILDMGEPVRIADVARQLIDQSGRDIEIVYTGLRDGEKLHEVLWSTTEHSDSQQHPLIAHTTVPELGVSRVVSAAAEARAAEEVVTLLKEWSGRVTVAEVATGDAAADEADVPPVGPREWMSIEK